MVCALIKVMIGMHNYLFSILKGNEKETLCIGIVLI